MSRHYPVPNCYYNNFVFIISSDLLNKIFYFICNIYVVVLFYIWFKIFQTSLILVFHCLVFIIVI